MDASLAICMRSAQLISGKDALMGFSRFRAFVRPALAPWLISGSKRIDPVAPPELGQSVI